jgi:hypothetical protein
MRAELRPDPADELLHDPWGDPSLPWKDTWYFSLIDPEARVHLAMHMTVSAGRNDDTRIALGLRDGARESVTIRREHGTHTEVCIGNTLAQLDVVNLSWDGDHQLRWRANAPEFGFDIAVRGVHFAPNFHAMFPGANPSGKQGHSYGHTEQVIRGEGTVSWRDGRRSDISSSGWRDRGWGRRKNILTFGAGYDLIGGILPDGTAFALTGMRNVEHGPDAPLPIYGFLTDANGAVPAISGLYRKDSMSFPALVALEFADGRRIDAEQTARLSTLGVPFHDAEPHLIDIAVNARDYYAMMADQSGARFAVFSNEGHSARTDVTRGAKFFYAGDLVDR